MIAIAILTVGCCLALVLDRLWLDAARGELQTAAEAAALAAANRLADDERINPNVESEFLVSAAMEAAGQIAGLNRVAGAPVRINPSTGDSLTFGSYTIDPDNGMHLFDASAPLPTSVRVRLQQTRTLGNPVARLFSGITGEVGGDAIATSEASLTNLVAGVRPFEGGPTPAFPFAIYERDPSNKRIDSWNE